MKSGHTILVALVIVGSLVPRDSWAQVPNIALNSVGGAPRTDVVVTLSLAKNGASVTAVSVDIIFNSQAIEVAPSRCSLAAGPTGIGSQLLRERLCVHADRVACVHDGDCPAGDSCARLRIGIAQFSLPIDSIPDGSLATCTYSVLPWAQAGEYVLEADAATSDAAGFELMTISTNGAINVPFSGPTRTPTRTPAPVPTATSRPGIAGQLRFFTGS